MENQKPKLKTVEEHNKEVFDAKYKGYAEPSGVACSRCPNQELYYNDSFRLLTNPPQKIAVCPICGMKEYLIV